MNATDTDEQELRELVALGCRVLAANGHDDFVWGHLAARDPHRRGVWMKRSGLGFEEITAADVILISFDGELLVGAGSAHVEWPIHSEVQLARDDIGATVHSHAPHCNAVAAAGQPLRPVSHAATMFVPPEVPRYTKTANLILTRCLGQEVAQALGDQNAMFLVNHGIVVAGSDVRDVVTRAVLFEKACHHLILTNAAGGIAHYTADDEALAKRQTIWSVPARHSLWEYLVRQLPQP